MSHRPLPDRRSVLRGSLAASATPALPTALGRLGVRPFRAAAGCRGVADVEEDVTSHSGLV